MVNFFFPVGDAPTPGCEDFVEFRGMSYMVTEPMTYDEGYHTCVGLKAWPAMFKTKADLEVMKFLNSNYSLFILINVEYLFPRYPKAKLRHQFDH